MGMSEVVMLAMMGHVVVLGTALGVWILQRDQIVGTCYESGIKDF